MSDEAPKPFAVPPKVIPGIRVSPVASGGATIRLKPVLPPGVVPAANATVQPMSPETAQAMGVPQSKSQTAPLPAAAKSKTSRIALDAVIGVTRDPIASGPAVASEEIKTIRLKRPTAAPVTSVSEAGGVLPAVRATSRIPMSAVADAAPEGAADLGDSSDVELTQKKTIKVKRPGLTLRSSTVQALAQAGGEGAVGAEGDAELKPLSDADMAGFSAMAPVREENKAFTLVAIIAASVAILVSILTICATGAQAMQPGAGPNMLGSIDAPSLPWK